LLYLEVTLAAKGPQDKEIFTRNKELCLHFLRVLDMIDPGLSRYRGEYL